MLAIALKYTYQLRGVNRGLLRGLAARYGQYLTHAHNHIIPAVRQSRSQCLRNLLGSGAMPCWWGPNEDETAVHNCHFWGDMVVRMLKVLVIPQSKQRSWYVCFSANEMIINNKKLVVTSYKESGMNGLWPHQGMNIPQRRWARRNVCRSQWLRIFKNPARTLRGTLERERRYPYDRSESWDIKWHESTFASYNPRSP